jgi:hypothetical protein
MAINPNNIQGPVDERVPLQPAERPIYGGLNVCNGRNVAAPHYGRSFFKLKPHVRDRCTFMPGDSWAVIEGMMPVSIPDAVKMRATLKHAEVLLCHIHEPLFSQILNQVDAGTPPCVLATEEDYQICKLMILKTMRQKNITLTVIDPHLAADKLFGWSIDQIDNLDLRYGEMPERHFEH